MSADAPTRSGHVGAGILDAENPWPGLVPFAEADRAYFRGREREAEALHRLVKRERLTVLFGKSGLGKSSLLQAGLFPRVRAENGLPVYLRLDFSDRAPALTAQVKAAIRRQAAAWKIEAPELRGEDCLWECFHRQNADFWNARNRVVLPLLVFDQFEEIFTLGRGDAARAETTEAFVAELADLVEGPPPAAVQARLDEHPEEAEGFVFDRHPYKVLLSLREDYLPELEGLRRRMGSVGRNRYRLRPMRGEAALEVAGQVPELIDGEVAERVVRFVAAARAADAPLAELEVEPALLSVVCRELNNKRQQAGEEKITVGLLAGSQEEILTDFYDRGVAGLPAEVRTFVEERLLTVSGYRDSVAMENALDAPGVTPEAINDLVARRLVRAEDRDGVQRLELTHDLLTGVITASRDARRRREAEAAERKARRQAERRERRARERLRASRRMMVLVLVLAALTAGAAVWAFQERKEAVRLQGIAEEQLKIAVEERERREEEEQLRHGSERQAVQALRESLKSDDLRTVWATMDRLVNEYDRQPQAVADDIPDVWFKSNRRFLQLAFGLHLASLESGRHGLASEQMTALAVRLSTVRGIRPPPTWVADEELNKRIRVSAGWFQMGSPVGEGEKDEHPRHRVELSAFFIQHHEVTNKEYRRFDPTHMPRAPADHPVVEASWYNATAYAFWLGGRLPTEAEWEYAAGAGCPHDYCDQRGKKTELEKVGWYDKNSNMKLHPVMKREPNPWGLYDMYGNAWEWVGDWYGSAYFAESQSDPSGPPSGEARVIRGGSSWDRAQTMRVASRSRGAPRSKAPFLGFRVVFPVAPSD